VLTQHDTSRECPVADCGFAGSLPAVYVHAQERAGKDDAAARDHATVAADPERYLGGEPQAVEFW
jgi:hypothetical protein